MGGYEWTKSSQMLHCPNIPGTNSIDPFYKQNNWQLYSGEGFELNYFLVCKCSFFYYERGYLVAY